MLHLIAVFITVYFLSYLHYVRTLAQIDRLAIGWFRPVPLITSDYQGRLVLSVVSVAVAYLWGV